MHINHENNVIYAYQSRKCEGAKLKRWRIRLNKAKFSFNSVVIQGPIQNLNGHCCAWGELGVWAPHTGEPVGDRVKLARPLSSPKKSGLAENTTLQSKWGLTSSCAGRVRQQRRVKCADTNTRVGAMGSAGGMHMHLLLLGQHFLLLAQ